MTITSYAALQSRVLDWLQRPDLAGVVPTFIQLAEASLRRDPRIRRLQTTPITFTASTYDLPSDCAAVESIWYDTAATNYREIDIVDPASLGDAMAEFSATGQPRRAAIVSPRTLRLAPAPDASYAAVLSYWATITPLGGSNLSNWLLESHPDIYLYATLVESAPYLADDARVNVWRTEREVRLTEFDMNVQRGTYSGSLVQRPGYSIP